MIAVCPYCQMNSAGQHEFNCPNLPVNRPTPNEPMGVVGGMGTGWKCPVCGKGNAPFALTCGHCAALTKPEGEE